MADPWLHYGFLRDFWHTAVAPAADRRCVVASMREGDLWLRDGYALALVRDCLHGRAGIDYRYVRAWAKDVPDPLPASDLLVLGRHDPYLSSALSEHVLALARKLKGRFHEGPRGPLGNTISYRSSPRRLTRHDLERGPEDHRRSDVDYAVLQIASVVSGGEARRVVGVAGISALGTMGLTMILADPVRRARLVRQVEEMLPWSDDLHPREYFELCVRIEIADEQHLDNFLNEPVFDFEAEVVCVGDDGKPRERDERVDLVLERVGDGALVVVKGAAPLRLTAGRYSLLRHLIKHPERTTTLELCAAFGISDATEKGAVLLAKRVHDLNLALRKLPPFQTVRPIRALKRRRGESPRYVLGARGMVKE